MENRRSEKPQLTIAQCIARSSDPLTAAIAAFVYRDVDLHSKTFHFEDESKLTFKVLHEVVQP